MSFLRGRCASLFIQQCKHCACAQGCHTCLSAVLNTCPPNEGTVKHHHDTQEAQARTEPCVTARTRLLQILMLVEQQMREEEAAMLSGAPRRRSADQYIGGGNKTALLLAVMVRALQFLKLADTSRLPVERTTLRKLLGKWGAFDHLGDGECQACDSPGEHARMAVVTDPESKLLKVNDVELDVNTIHVRLAVHSKLSC